MYIASMECCGIRELGNVSSAGRNVAAGLRSFMRNHGHPDNWTYGAFIMTEARTGTYCLRLAKLVERLNLGTITAVPQFVNPNTMNAIRMYIWVINRQRLGAWVDAGMPALFPMEP